MTHHSYVDVITAEVEAYRTHPSVRWAFSNFWQKSFKYDLRYHVYGTVDCLRKFPIFIYEDNLKLNQGFHDLVKAGNGSMLESDDYLLPIRQIGRASCRERV